MASGNVLVVWSPEQENIEEVAEEADLTYKDVEATVYFVSLPSHLIRTEHFTVSLFTFSADVS